MRAWTSLKSFGCGTRGESSITSSDSGVVINTSAGSLRKARFWESLMFPCHRKRRSLTMLV
jgi:hypothetical protein